MWAQAPVSDLSQNGLPCSANSIALIEFPENCSLAPSINPEAFRISSGNSFTHETESQVVLSGSCDQDLLGEKSCDKKRDLKYTCRESDLIWNSEGA